MRHVHLHLISIAFLIACSPSPEACGNSVCVSAAGETCSTCPTDCGSCGSDAGPSDAGPGACGIMAGHWTGTGTPDPTSTDPECMPQSFDQNLGDRFLVDYPAMASSCLPGCTCSLLFGSADPPDCMVANGLDCSTTSSGITSTSGWRRISGTELAGTYIQSTPGRGDCTLSYIINWVGP